MRPVQRRTVFWFVGLTVLLATVFVAGCSGGKDDDNEAVDPTSTVVDRSNLASLTDAEDACGIFTIEDASAALGAEVELVTEFDFDLPASFRRCEYKELDGRRVTRLLVQVGQSLEKFTKEIERTEAFNDPERISGVAERAFWVTGGLNQLYMLEGDNTLTILVGSSRLNPSGQLLEDIRDVTVETGRKIIQRVRGESVDPVVSDGPGNPGDPDSGIAPTAVPESLFTRAGDSFEDNLFSGVDSGDWTIGEGLVATLQLLAGERDSSDVLRSPDLASRESTGVIEMAQEYAEDGPDPAIRTEVQRLLDRLIFTAEQLDAMVIPDTASLPADRAFFISTTRSSTEDCARFYDGWPSSARKASPECLKLNTVTVGPSTFSVYSPALEEPETGWTDRHTVLVLVTIEETIEQTFLRLGKMPVNVRIVLSPQKDSDALASAIRPTNSSDCTITLYRGMQELKEGNYKQTVAHEFAHCFQNATLAAQKVPLKFRRWREEGFAEYLSDVAYPSNDFEARYVTKLGANEVRTATVKSRTYDNYLWFAFWSDQLNGDAALIDVLRTGPTSGGHSTQQDFLAALPGIASTHHEFAKAISDDTVADRSGGDWPVPTALNGKVSFDSAATYVMASDFEPFGVGKWEFSVPRGTQVTTRIEGSGLQVSSRGVEDVGNWVPVEVEHTFAAGCDEVFRGLLVVSSTEEPASFELDVFEVEDIDCEDAPDPLPVIVGHDSCVVGTWAMNLGEFRRIVEEQLVDDVNVVSVTGDVLVSFLEDGGIESEITQLAFAYLSPWEGVENRLRAIMQWDGAGGGSWNADGSRIQILTRAFNIVSSQRLSLDNGPVYGGINPPADDLFESSIAVPAGEYRCTQSTLEITGVKIGTEQAVWERR